MCRHTKFIVDKKLVERGLELPAQTVGVNYQSKYSRGNKNFCIKVYSILYTVIGFVETLCNMVFGLLKVYCIQYTVVIV